MKIETLAATMAAALAVAAQAQDATRGARLYAETAKLTGRPVASCVACHADMGTLRELIRNRGGHPDDPVALARWLDAVISGAQTGAANAKSQYRGVLTAADLRDLAAYIARAMQARTRLPELAGVEPR
jgi:mono/diheme cytochrome c family protein